MGAAISLCVTCLADKRLHSVAEVLFRLGLISPGLFGVGVSEARVPWKTKKNAPQQRSIWKGDIEPNRSGGI